MDKQVDESKTQESSKKSHKMVMPEETTYSQHDEKQQATHKSKPDDKGHVNTEDETYLDKKG